MALWDYLLAMGRKEQALVFEIQTCFDELAYLLGDKHDLMNEFTNIYRDVHGAIMQNISAFIELGLASASH